MDYGFVKIPRKLYMTNIFRDGSPLNAYLVIMSEMRYTDTVTNGIKVKKGQLLISQKELAFKMNRSIPKTRYILNRFEELGGIKKENIKNRYTLITVLEPFLTGNFDKTILFSSEETTEEKEQQETEMPLYEKAESRADEKISAKKEPEKKAEFSVSEKTKTDSKNTDGNKGENKNTLSETKKAYGLFSNVMLNDREYREFSMKTDCAAVFIDMLSAKLKNAQKQYPNHYALLINNLSEHRLKNPDFEKKNAPLTPDPTASYDIMLAEEMAKTVPKVRKRKR